jgi:hypothetical protein
MVAKASPEAAQEGSGTAKQRRQWEMKQLTGFISGSASSALSLCAETAVVLRLMTFSPPANLIEAIDWRRNSQGPPRQDSTSANTIPREPSRSTCASRRPSTRIGRCSSGHPCVFSWLGLIQHPQLTTTGATPFPKDFFCP